VRMDLGNVSLGYSIGIRIGSVLRFQDIDG